MKFFSSKRRLAMAAAILLALFVIRPGASRLKSRIIYSISAAVGRPVDIGSVHIHFLPRPGFDLQNLVVYDDPAFGAEPIVRASDVTAALRLMSLLRGRLEIARLDLSEPSLNLVHGDGGHWNLEALLERAARIPLAPTGKRKSEPRPAFPYIEATSGRINFKNGPEKKPYALTNADFSLWQDSENTWGVRLKAQPFRTDMNLNDMGLLQLSGTWQRAEALRDTPLQVNLEWTGGQLGQLTKLVTGNDQGWRGDLVLDMALNGTPAKLQISATSSLDDFRRYDITSGKKLRMSARCDAEYGSDTHEIRQLMCDAPVGDGLITITGDTGLPGSHRYSVVLTAEKVPAATLARLAARVKKGLPDDLAADGTLQAKVSLQSNEASAYLPEWKGRGEIVDLDLTSDANKAEIGPQTLAFVVSTGSPAKESARKSDPSMPAGMQPGARVDIGPLSLGASRPGAATIRGSVNRAGYRFSITGEADIAKALRLARMAGVPAIASNVEGSAQLDLLIAGNWLVPGNGFAVPQVTGTARLHNVQIPARSAGVPAEIVSAEMQLVPNAVHVNKLNAKAAGTSWTGSVDLPRGCGTPAACPVHFAMNTKEVSLSNIHESLNPNSRKPAWYRVLGLSSDSRPAWWTSLHASGRITADRFHVHGVEATGVSANLNVQDGKLQVSALNANLLGGTYEGEWRIEFAKRPALCIGSGTMSGISLASVAEAMNDGWVAGTATASYDIKAPCAADFWPSADAKFRVEVTDGIFPHVMIGDGTEALQASAIRGEGHLHNGEIKIADTQLISPERSYNLSGTASLRRQLDLKLTAASDDPANVGYSIAGMLDAPRVSQLSRTEQARLKSVATK